MFFDNEIFDEIYREGEDGIPEFKFYAESEWKFGDSFREITSPIDGETIARLAEPTEEQVMSALDHVEEKGKAGIRDQPGETRIECFLEARKIIEENFDEFLEKAMKDAGKPRANAEGEVNATMDRLEKTTMEMRGFLGDYVPGDWGEETLESEGIVKKEPYGLILAISPFNYPLFISSTKVVPSLLSGNAVILKPPIVDPITPLMFTRALELSGLPKSSFATLTTGGRETTPLVKDNRVRAITFTGSTSVGEKIIEEAGIKSFHMELGGKDPAVVLGDADLDKTARKIRKGVTSYSGQRCDAIRMILVMEDVYAAMKQKIKQEFKDMEPKNPFEDEDAIMGPLIDEESAKQVEEAHNDAVEKGANPLTDFERDGNYVKPTILEADKENLSDLKVYREEIFGPLALLIRVKDKEEAVEIANSTEFGLDGAVFGTDEAEIRKVIRNLEVGAVFVNEYPRHGIGYYPFGGMKSSGIGREGIGYSINQLTTTKTIVHNYRGYGVWEYL